MNDSVMEQKVAPPSTSVDTIEKADRARLLQGEIDTEVTFGGEADLRRHYTQCTKNPTHDGFIPINDFKIEHLPSRYQDSNIYELLRLNAQLTVRVTVHSTSQDRQAFHDHIGASNRYPFYDFSGSDMVRSGTGRIWGALNFNDSDKKPCPCDDCKNTGNKTWGKISVYTARHVVFDSSEGRNTKVRWGFDHSDSDVVELNGVGVGDCDYRADMCEVICATHDTDFVDTLIKIQIKFGSLFAKVYGKYKNDSNHRLAVIISHPHGCPKQVSIGEWTERHDEIDHKAYYVYNTCTCPGSSGAGVYILGKLGTRFSHLHSGAMPSAHGGAQYVNYSGLWV